MHTFLFKCFFIIGVLSYNSFVIGDVGKCPSGAQFCHFSAWLPWESCNLTSSGELKQTRQRNLCCEIKRDCLKTCNISISTYGSMYKEERRCIGEIAEATKCTYFLSRLHPLRFILILYGYVGGQ